MSSEDIKIFRTIVETGGQSDANRILQHVSDAGDGTVDLEIPVNKTFRGVRIDNITMVIGQEDDGSDGDLAVNYTVDPKQISGKDAMKIFYVDRAFDSALAGLLVKAGFSSAAAKVSGSEGGMQEEGRASYDADGIAAEVRNALSSARS